jgi:hypothetical protein
MPFVHAGSVAILPHVRLGDFLEAQYPWDRTTGWTEPGPLPPDIASIPGAWDELVRRGLQDKQGCWARARSGSMFWAVTYRDSLLRTIVHMFVATPEAPGRSSTTPGLPPGAPPANAIAAAMLRISSRAARP